jgi:hypothetical protein
LGGAIGAGGSDRSSPDLAALTGAEGGRGGSTCALPAV